MRRRPSSAGTWPRALISSPLPNWSSAPRRPSMRGSPAATCGRAVARPWHQAQGRRCATGALAGLEREERVIGTRPHPRGDAMTVQTLHIPLPEAIVQRLQRVAEATHQPLEAVVVQTICGNLPPAFDDLSPALHAVVADLPTLHDDALWG